MIWAIIAGSMLTHGSDFGKRLRIAHCGARYVGIDRYDRFALVLCGRYFVPKTVFNGLDV
jgi:hypothetical protein